MKKLYVVGIGPGRRSGITHEALQALESSDTIIGYTKYVSLIEDWLTGKELISTPMKKEIERCKLAFEIAAKGRVVAMVCSGDAGVYAMASPILELSPEFLDVEVEIISGVSASMTGAALLGAPLGHDFATISLSDLLTPWEVIEKRLLAASSSDMAIVLYNPRSKGRSGHLARAVNCILSHQAPETICGWARNIGRDGEACGTLSLIELRDFEADMFTTVYVGNSNTRLINERMVMPRGYKKSEERE